MFVTATVAVAMGVSVWFRFWFPEDPLAKNAINALRYTLIATSTFALTFTMWKMNFRKEKRKNDDNLH